MNGAHAATRPRSRPSRRPEPGQGGRHLQVVRPQRRRSPAVPVLVGVGIVLVALFAIAAMHALMIGRQVQLDDMNRSLASEMEEVERLRLRVAELEAPDRVLDVARTRLGMVEPTDVGYVLPVEVVSVSEDLVRVTPATAPTTTTVPVPAPSPEQAEIDVSVGAAPPEADGETAPDAVTGDTDTTGEDDTTPTTMVEAASGTNAPEEGAGGVDR